MAFYSKFADYYDSIFPFKQPVFDLLKNTAHPKTRDILDVGCGTGHYAAHFSTAGFSTTGIDLDAAMIEYAKKHYPETNFVTMNMLDIEALNHQFDFIFCIGNTVAHLNQKEFDIFIQSVYHVLRPGGAWIFQVRNWDYVIQQQKYDFPIIKAESRVEFTRSYTKISADTLHFNTRLTDDDSVVFEDSVTMYPLSSRHYLDIHQRHHFQLVNQYSDFKRTPYDPNADTAHIFIFQK